MANRYWVGGTASWDGTAGTKWATTSGGAGGAAVPTSSDNVFFDASSGAVTITQSGSRVCNNLDCTGFTGTFTRTSAALTVSGSFKLVPGMTYTCNQTATTTFNATATGKTIAFAGKSTGPLTFNGSGGGWTLQDDIAFVGSNDFTLTQGTLDLNGKTVNLLAAVSTSDFLISGTGTKVLTMGAANVTCRSWLHTGTNCTINEGTSVINWTGTFTGNSETYYALSGTAAGALTISDSNTFTNITRTGTAVKTDSIIFGASQTITGTLTFNGNGTTNRLHVRTTNGSTSVILTAAVVSCSYADFENITGAGAGSWNLAAITGLSGDCGGNSGITFTTPVTNYWVGGTGNWADVAEWASSSGGAASSGRVPLPQDAAIFDANSFSAGSQTVTQNMSRIGSVNFTGATNSPTFTTSTVCDYYGSITLISAMTLSSSTHLYTYRGKGAATLTSAGKTWEKPLQMDCGSGTLSLADTIRIGNNGRFVNMMTGTLDFNDQNVLKTGTGNILSMAVSDLGTVNLGNGILEHQSSGVVMSINGGTLNAEGSTILCSYTGTNTRGFYGGGNAYYKVEFAAAASVGVVTIYDSNTFQNQLKLNPNGAIRFQAGTTQTLSSAAVLQATGTSGNVITIDTTVAGSAATLSCASGTVSCNYLSLKDSTATGGASFYAGANSTNVSGNTGWTFTAPPSGGSTVLMTQGSA